MVDIKHSMNNFPDHVEYLFTCPVCKTNLNVAVQRELVQKQDRFPFEFLNIHGEPQHGIAIFIDKNWVIRAFEIVKNINIANTQELLIPKRKGTISPMAKQLGIVSKKEFEILEKSDGKRSLSMIANLLHQSMEEIQPSIQKLIEKGMLQLDMPK